MTYGHWMLLCFASLWLCSLYMIAWVVRNIQTDWVAFGKYYSRWAHKRRAEGNEATPAIFNFYFILGLTALFACTVLFTRYQWPVIEETIYTLLQ